MTDLGALTAAHFTPLIHERFTMSAAGQAFEVELVEVTEITREPGGRAPFSLVFEGGPNPPVPQRICRVDHERLGAIEIFVVPIAANRYEAVFT